MDAMIVDPHAKRKLLVRISALITKALMILGDLADTFSVPWWLLRKQLQANELRQKLLEELQETLEQLKALRESVADDPKLAIRLETAIAGVVKIFGERLDADEIKKAKELLEETKVSLLELQGKLDSEGSGKAKGKGGKAGGSAEGSDSA